MMVIREEDTSIKTFFLIKEQKKMDFDIIIDEKKFLEDCVERNRKKLIILSVDTYDELIKFACSRFIEIDKDEDTMDDIIKTLLRTHYAKLKTDNGKAIYVSAEAYRILEKYGNEIKEKNGTVSVSDIILHMEQKIRYNKRCRRCNTTNIEYFSENIYDICAQCKFGEDYE